MPSVWEEIQGGKGRRGVVKQLDDFMRGYREVVDALPLRDKQDGKMLAANYNIFDVEHEKERDKELSARATAGKEYTTLKGNSREFPLEIPIKDKDGNVLETFKLNKYGSFQPLEYFVVANANNTITINMINTRQLDFLKPNIVFFWGGNKYTNKKKDTLTARKMY